MALNKSKIITKAVDYQHGGAKLEGFLAYRSDVTKKAPGILILPEWWGLTEYLKERAQQVAALGYVAFVADMYGKGVMADNPKRAGELAGPFYGKPLMAQRAQAGLDILLKTSRVDKTRTAAIGYCFGGTTALALAYSGAAVKGAASFHGGLIPPPAKPASKAKFLICHGAIDGFISHEEQAAFLKGMNAGGYDYQFISYSGAVHAFTNPDADATAARTGLKGIAYNATADRRSWKHLQVFFDDIFAGK